MNPSLPRIALNVAVLTLLLLLIPLVAMQFTSEVNWGPGDFGTAALLLFSAGMAYRLACLRVHRKAHRVTVAVIVLAVLAIIWAELAVGLFH